MKIGKFILDEDGAIQEIVESTVYDTFAEAKQAAESLKLANANNQQVVDIFMADEISSENYRISVVL